MICVQRARAYALMICVACFTTFTAVASGSDAFSTTEDQFHWNEHKLTWEDFRGAVNAPQAESAAATYCSIGFKVANDSATGKPVLVIYNEFYKDKSWVRSDAHIQSILDHEQGHFDLCEIYTRKLRERMMNFDLSSPAARHQLLAIYTDVNKEYEARQQAYEQQTVHGTNLEAQHKWQQQIAQELM